MRKQYSWLYSLAIIVIAVLVIGPQAYADVFNDQMKALQADRARVASQLGLVETYRHASSYYDDLVDHYEQDQLMRDVIDEGIR